ncbi:MAG: IS66 family transposase [Planctomycetes bacterium]|nr:IS66 family transposase [Planctomycetota bacterium]
MHAIATLDLNALPDDSETLKKMLVEAGEELQERELDVLRLKHLLGRFQRWQFGAKSERVPEGQQIFAFYGTLEAEPADESSQPEPLPRARPRPKRGGYRVIPADLPRQVVVQDLTADEKRCPGCGLERACIGFDETRQIDFTPASFFEYVLRRMKYACTGCEKHVATAPLPVPAGPIEKGLPGFGLLANILVAKYADHLPLYRQSRIYARHGVEIPRSTLCDWVGRATTLLSPIVEAIMKDVLASRILKTDDTVVRMQVPWLDHTVQARLWGYLGDAHHNQVGYEFTPNRNEEHPLRILAGFKGFVQADAYKGYDKLFRPGSGRTELGCMAHARRYFFEARDTDPQRGSTAIGFIRTLYEVEAMAAGLSPQERAAVRRQKASPILGSFKGWLDQEALKLIPGSPMSKAFGYALNQWEALNRYVDDGEASIDNNAMERTLRGVAIGRKNYLFVGSEAGGRWAAVAYSLIESCKLNGVEPYRYLKDVLRRVWTHPASGVDELMPRLWKPPPDSS